MSAINWSPLIQRLAQVPLRGEAPAAVFLAWRKLKPPLIWSAGKATVDTIFDLASLTKPLGTLSILLNSLAEGHINWNTSLLEIWGSQAVPPDKHNLTLRQLAAHEAGFAAYARFPWEESYRPYKQIRSALKAWLLGQPLIYPPGQDTLYSDLGYMLLGLLLEDAAGAPLPRLLAKVYHRLGLRNAPRYLPLHKLRPWPLSRIAACGALPGRPRIWGEVEDENAWSLNGVAGHAGLFGCARGVAAVMDALWRAGQGQGIWPAEILRPLWLESRSGGGRSVGFDLPQPPSQAGDLAPAQVVGHLGFTGVSAWWHVPSGRGLVLLTNRVAYGRHNQSIRELRRQLHDLAWPNLMSEA